MWVGDRGGGGRSDGRELRGRCAGQQEWVGR